MKLNITPRAANLQYAIRDIVVAAKQYEKRTGEKPLYLNIGDPIKYDWKTPQYMVDAICKAAQDGWNGYSPSDGEEKLRIAAALKRRESTASYCFSSVPLTTTNSFRSDFAPVY